MLDSLNISTLIYTCLEVSVLLGIVLLLRKPLARVFGSKAAYVFWVLPVIGILVPKIRLQSNTGDFPTEIITTYSSVAEKSVVRPLSNNVSEMSIDMLKIGIMAWVIVGGLWFAFQFFSYLRHYKNNKISSKPVTSAQMEIAAEVAKAINLKSMPQIRTCLEGGTASVMGVIRPMVILPQDFNTKYSAEEQRLVLAHEMMHIKRKDLWAGFLALSFRAINWPNPLAHIAAHYFRIDQEAACDASVLKALRETTTTSAYMNTVVKTAQTSTQT